MRFKPRYKQLTIDGFRSSLDGLDKTNRWVWLGDHLPWEDYEQQYGQKLNNQTVGAGAKPARMVIGAMVIKHATRLSDVDTIQMIQENPYMQYLCGLEEFTDQPIFDPFFVDLRKRISEDDINKMTESLLKREQEMKEAASKQKEEEIKSYSKPLGRPPKEPPSPERQAAMTRAVGKRNEIECSFGTGKRVYQANDIRAKLPDTAECWTGMCYFAKNVMKFFMELCHTLYDLLRVLTLVTIAGAGLRHALQVEAN